MEKNIKDFIHFYLGCECVHTFVPEDHPQYDNGWKLVSIQSRSEKPYELDNGIHYTWTDSIKPKLRKLESMTEEEASEMWAILGWNERINPANRASDIIKEFSTIEEDNGTTNNAHWGYFIMILPYLLSKGFDLFGLLDSGLATEKQPTTQNQGV